VEVVENAIGYKCEISPATNDLNVVQIPNIYISVQCIFNIFITGFRHIMNLLTRPMYYRVYIQGLKCAGTRRYCVLALLRKA